MGFTALAALACAAGLGREAAGKAALLCGAAGGALLLWGMLRRVIRRTPAKRKWVLPAACVCLTAGLFLGIFLRAWDKQVAPVQSFAGQEGAIRATVLDYPERAYGRVYYTVRVESLRMEGERVEIDPFTVRMTSWQPMDCEPYDLVECTVSFYEFDRTGGLYSTRNSRLADGVVLGAYRTGKADCIPGLALPPGEIAVRLRELVGRAFAQQLPEDEAGLLRGILLGQRERVPESVYDDFLRLGVSHLLVVSGLHLSVLAALFRFLFGRLPFGRAGRNGLTALVVLVFLVVIGFPASAVRSGIMLLIFLLADSLGRETDSANSLGAAVLVICLFHPFAGGDLGFALSAMATLGILLFAKELTGLVLRPFGNRPGLRRALRPVAGVLGVNLSVLVMSLPIQMLVFRGLPLIAPLANLVLIFPCQLLLYLAIPPAVLGLMPALQPLAAPFAFCAGWLARVIFRLARWLAALPGVFLDLTEPLLLLALGVTPIFLFFAVGMRRRKRAVCLLLAGLTATWAAGFWMVDAQRKGVVTLAVAADSSAVLMIRDNRAAVLALGGYRTDTADSLLRRANVRAVETLCMPLRDPDAREAAAELLRVYPTERLLLPEDAYVGRDLLTAGGDAEIAFVAEGENFTLLEDISGICAPEMARTDFSVYGVQIAVETGENPGGECDLLFTTGQGPVGSVWTVLIGDGDAEAPPGSSIRPGESGLFIDIYPDGTMNVRGETDA